MVQCRMRRWPLALLLSGAAWGQATTAPADLGVMTLRATSRLTLVDVTVTDSKGQPIRGLKASEFRVEEDGKEQPIHNFDESRAEVPRPVRPPPTLPPHIYTNLQPPPTTSSVNVLLLDALNTKLTDQAFVKSETMQFLKNMAPGTRVAILTLSNQLRILQGFTQDPAILTAAVNSRNNRQVPSPLLSEDVQNSNDSIADVVDAGTAASLQEFANETNAFQTDMRNRMTLQALDQIAAFLATVPGRKNLIWFTAGMPLHIFPTGGVNDIASMTDYSRDLRHTTDLLTAAQVAVYPIDAQGLHGSQANAAMNGGGGFANGRGGPAMAAANLAFTTKTAQEQLSMEAVAEATGGVAYYNTNGLKEAVGKAIANGSNYYTLAYIPPNPVYDGAFHKIHVKVTQPGAHLSYRTGYYADDVAHNAFASPDPSSGTALPATSDAAGVTMESSMRRGVPVSSQILFDVRVEPHTDVVNPPGTEPLGHLNPKLKDKALKRYDVQYIFPGRQISFAGEANHVHKGGLQFEVAAYDVQGTMLTSLSQSVDLPLSDDAFLKLQKSPFQFFQQLDLPAGDIFLRIGIHDLTSHKIGTLEIPLTITKKPGVALSQGPGAAVR